MKHDARTSRHASSVTTVQVDRDARVIILHGAIRGDAVEKLHEQLLAAIAAGVREVFLDLSEAESIDSPVQDLVAAASTTLADRGGVLLAWSRNDAPGDPGYLIADVRDRALDELIRATTRQTAGGR